MIKVITYCFTFFYLLNQVIAIDVSSFKNNTFNDSIKIICNDTGSWETSNFKGYDYRSQSYYTSLQQGDSLNITIIVYAKQDFRITALCDKSLGSISYKIVEPNRENISKINKINENEEIIYKLDEYGEQILGGDDKPVVLSKEILRDTIWDNTVIVHETILYDNETSDGISFYDIKNLEASKRLVIKLKVNGNTVETRGCVAILVGRKYVSPFKIANK